MTDFGTSNGVTLAKINTTQPAVIPAGYQDGKFVDVGGTDMTGSLTRKYHASKTDFTSVSASGYYNFHGLKVGLATGSGNYTFKDGTTKNNFWAPIDQIESDIGSNTLGITSVTQSYVRLCIGIEHVDDIINDLDQALNKSSKGNLKAVS